ncbi:MauE/DoxX family redox-associated membrane protein [Hufsiella ginkgonis]|uniref:Methylamine utilisation protein MauE domain-containing protein n=1 Tax=Hufsiella ginkgonis TaxID=2695274 RepID=A0A7K1XYN0_9SPHI|nr:MauE/DoxX family redox-associated membrane protein [Hufsiella ginkgonis]MXV16080.1 hypothetical protein [Hufsiella ginkgonis]
MPDYPARRAVFPEIVVNAACFLLILLWTYAALSKLADYSQARQQMLNQLFPFWLSGILVWLVPVTELVAAGLLSAARTRKQGLYLSSVLMAVFTGYIILVMCRVFDRVPCSCGGILSAMSWRVHLVFNLFFLVLAFTAICLFKISGSKSGKPAYPHS